MDTLAYCARPGSILWHKVRAPPYEEALGWLHFYYMGYQTGTYVATASMDSICSVVVKWGPLFVPTFLHLQRRYPAAYAPLPTSTIASLGLDYVNYPPIDWKPELRDGITGLEGGLMYNIIPSLIVTNKLTPNVLILDIHPTGQ